MDIIVKNGNQVSIGFTATDRRDNQGKKVGTIVSFRDITLFKQMQSEVLRMDRLASLGVLASGIAHEIKNPLAGIKTLAQACEEEFESTDPRQEYLTRIIRQVNRLDELLKTFFAYAKPKPPIQKKYKLSEIVQEVTPLVSKKLSECSIAYVEEIDSSLPDVMVDSQQMQQVFLNLILNAIDAMQTGGTLTVTAKTVEKPLSGILWEKMDTSHKKNALYIETIVTDTGEGIKPDQIKTIFDPFYTTKPGGLGLGLSIVYRIIEENRGDIRVESQVGKGTAFIITLPTGAIE
jgi:signal transduction histidine kinase